MSRLSTLLSLIDLAIDVIVFSRWLGKYHYDILKRIADAGKPYVIDVTAAVLSHKADVKRTIPPSAPELFVSQP